MSLFVNIVHCICGLSVEKNVGNQGFHSLVAVCFGNFTKLALEPNQSYFHRNNDTNSLPLV